MIERNTTAGILIKDGHVFVAKRVKGGALSGMWEFPGGKNRYGETLEETLKREYMEELSISIAVKEEICQTEFINKDTHYTLHAFLIESDEENIALSVHTNYMLADKETLLSLPMGQSDSVIRDYVALNLL